MSSSGVTVPVEHTPARAGEALRSSVSVEKAGRELGWHPAVALRDGLAQTFAYFAAHRAAPIAPKR